MEPKILIQNFVEKTLIEMEYINENSKGLLFHLNKSTPEFAMQIRYLDGTLIFEPIDQEMIKEIELEHKEKFEKWKKDNPEGLTPGGFFPMDEIQVSCHEGDNLGLSDAVSDTEEPTS